MMSLDFTSRDRNSSLSLQFFLQPGRYPVGHQPLDVSPEHRQLLHSAGAQEAELRRGHQIDALDVRGHLSIELVHLELVLEVRDRPQPLDDGSGAVLTGEIDEEGIKGFYLHIPMFRDLDFEESDPLFAAAPGLLLA